MPEDDDSGVINALSGYGLNNILAAEGLPSVELYANRLGINGVASITADDIYNSRYDDGNDDDAIGADVGEDMEEDVEPEPGKSYLSDVEVETPDGGEVARRPKRTKQVTRKVERPKTVNERYPAFHQGGILAFSELFKGHINRKSRISKRPFHVYPVYPYRKDAPKGYLQSIVNDVQREAQNRSDIKATGPKHIDDNLLEALQSVLKTLPSASRLLLQDRTFDLVHLSDWEDQIVFSPSDIASKASMMPNHQEQHPHPNANPTNLALESGDWTKSIIWEPKAPFRDFTQLELNEMDGGTTEYPSYNQDGGARKRHKMDHGPVRDKFNLSNDHLYELPKHLGVRHRVRQTFGQLEVEHAYPAKKLQLPFYKTRLSKQDARSFHRPPLQFHANVECHFTKVRTAKKKKDKSGRTIGKGGDFTEGIHYTSDLSLRETSNFVLWEYSEEHPSVLNNFGMGSILVNYYRKKTDSDDHVPKVDYGEPFVLEPNDDSPFMRFGYVYAGQTVPSLYNNLVRAPLFRHKPHATDFLVVRTTIKGDVRYHLRDIRCLYTVGQTFPVTEVPGPHSRKITTTVKHRLQAIAFKLLRKSPEERLKINRLMKYFPDQNELQMRQRLKEFMEYHRRGPHQGFWRLKPTVTIPSDADMIKMLSPESVILAESMQVGQRHLQDLGYGQASDAAAEDGDDSNLSVEQQLAPWIISKNFQQASQNKAMLKLHGDGDPSGRGEAFSFIRVSMKEIFVRAGENFDQKMAEADNRPKHAHRYNVQEQQVIYRSEVERIWKAQFDSLTRKEEPELSDSEDNSRTAVPPKKFRREQSLGRAEMSRSIGSPAVESIASPTFSRESSLDRDVSLGPDGATTSVLRIRRYIEGQWETEIVRDSAVVNAYVRRRQLIEEETTKADALAPTGDAERDKRAKKRLEEEIARMKKNQERRLIRKNAKIIKDGGIPLQLRRAMKPDTTRRCGLCGQIGHMKTNRKCPKWAEANAAGGPPPLGTISNALSTNSNANPSTSALSVNSTPSTPLSRSNSMETYMHGLSAPAGPAHRASSSHIPSPLASSPPVSGLLDQTRIQDTPDNFSTPTTSGGPKLKLTLKRS